MLCSTIRDIIVRSAEKYGTDDAIRYKKGKKEIEAKTYQQLKDDSEKFSAVLKEGIPQGIPSFCCCLSLHFHCFEAGKWQATECPKETSIKGGMRWRQTSCAI